jgi:hypothetical protein
MNQVVQMPIFSRCHLSYRACTVFPGLAFENPSMVLVVSHLPLNIHASRKTLPETLRGIGKGSVHVGVHVAAECKVCVEQVDISWGDEERIGEVDVCG